jgi:TonB-linked SusC/RagA family outer membrane protein
MRITFFLFFLGVLQSYAASTYAQTTQLTIHEDNIELGELLNKIEKQTEFYFFYNNDKIDKRMKVNAHAEGKTITEVLDVVLNNTGVTYQVNNKAIILNLAANPVSLQARKNITGVIVDEHGEPVIGANVLEKGTTNGSITNIDGQFSLSVSENAVLQISYIGYISQDVTVGNRTHIPITLKEDFETLEEVVVVGYGTQRKATLTGSITTVKGEDMIKTPTTNASHMLAGRMAGVTTVQSSGEPGADDATIRIRGVNTIGNSDPLVVVDGVPGRSLSRIDPASIETITVLKDASAAIYGSQAANGVILITTKRGSTGKPNITLNFNQGFSQPTRIPDMTDGSEYATLINELDMYEGRTPRYSQQDIANFTSGSDPWKYPNTDWFDAVLKPWSAQNNLNAQMTGGKDEVTYFISAGSKYQDAFYRNSVSDYKQLDFRSNLDVKISIGLYGRMENTTAPAIGRLTNMTDASSGYETIFRTATLASPNVHAVWPDGSPGPDILEGNNPVTIATNASGSDKNKK